MKVIIKTLRMIVVLLSVGTLLGYYIITSDVPPLVELNDLHIFLTMHLMVILITIIDFTICIKRIYRGGYFTLFFELIIAFLWALSYNGVNFHMSNTDASCVIMNILYGGIITSIIQILSQLICLINSMQHRGGKR